MHEMQCLFDDSHQLIMGNRLRKSKKKLKYRRYIGIITAHKFIIGLIGKNMAVSQ